MDLFTQELIDCLDYYNNRRIKAKLEGLPPVIHRRQALSAAQTVFVFKYCLTFGGRFTMIILCFLLIFGENAPAQKRGHRQQQNQQSQGYPEAGG